MLTLNDGRSELWQWDTGRTLSVDVDCSQVHFSNKVFGRSIDVDVVDGAAIIPDVLLQTDKDLNVWAFVGTAENGYTKISKTFQVNRRNKPADYVFTPTDQMTLQTIQRQIGDLADLTTEAKDTLVAAINEAARTGGGAGSMELRVADGYIQYSTDSGSTWQNLIAVAELKGDPGIYYGTTPPTGDTHPVWIDPGGYPDDGGLLPAVTAADNGKVLRVVSSAWAAEDMPTGGTDMGITGATVGQIAKITAVDDTGKPTAWSPVDMPSGGEKWETILDLTLEEDVNKVVLMSSDVGYKKILVYMESVPPTDQKVTSNKAVSFYSGETDISNATAKINGAYLYNGNRLSGVSIELTPYAANVFVNGPSGWQDSMTPAEVKMGYSSKNSLSKPIKKLTAQVWGNALFGTGSWFKVYGVRV